MKRLLSSLLLCTLLCVSATAADNLLSNGDFEVAKTNFLFGADFEDWTFGGIIAIETQDVYSGKQAFRTTEVKQTRSLEQTIDLQADVTGQEFEMVVHYKVLSANAGDLSLNSAWNFRYPQDGTPHDSIVLNQVLPLGNNDWQELKIKTTKPQDATSFQFSIAVKKGVLVIFDAFSFARTESQLPWYTVMPETIAPARSNIGDEVLMTTLTIRQGNITEPIQLYITGANSDMFRLEKAQVTAAEETVKLWYAPTAVGNHKAMLITDCSQALGDNKTYPLSGVASDSTQKPEIHITPTSLPAFTAKAGTQVRDSIVVTSLLDCYLPQRRQRECLHHQQFAYPPQYGGKDLYHLRSAQGGYLLGYYLLVEQECTEAADTRYRYCHRPRPCYARLGDCFRVG